MYWASRPCGLGWRERVSQRPGWLELQPHCSISRWSRALSASIEVLRAIAAGTGPSRWLVALGYAGWGAGQLDGEMRRHGWFAAGGHHEVLFKTPAEERWRAAWKAEGIDPALLASETGRA